MKEIVNTYETLAEFTNKEVHIEPLQDTAAFINANSQASDSMTEDSAFFSRNQIVLKDATFGDPIAEKSQTTFK